MSHGALVGTRACADHITLSSRQLQDVHVKREPLLPSADGYHRTWQFKSRAECAAITVSSQAHGLPSETLGVVMEPRLHDVANARGDVHCGSND